MAERANLWAEIDLGKIQRNVRRLHDLVAPSKVLAVVKANGYGHGDVQVAQAAVRGGASWLGVARIEEGEALRAAGISKPILLLSEPLPELASRAVELALTPTIYTEEGLQAFARAGRGTGRRHVPVHVKVDTGMHRYGIHPSDASGLMKKVLETDGVEAEGIWSHFASADSPRDPFISEQLRRFREVVQSLPSGLSLMRHICNSAGSLVLPEARMEMVRCGISVYGIPPSEEVAGTVELEPAMSLKSRVALVKRVEAGERLSYGQHYEVTKDSNVATIPIGYADGVLRAWGRGGQVLINGKRYPIAGTITMDHLLADLGDDNASRGDEVVLFGEQAGEAITAVEIATRIGTIPYEIVCGVSARVPRVYLTT